MLQRLRITYRKDGPARYIAHLDVMRTWERAIRRAKLPLAYTQGFSPHPRIAFAAPLPVGTLGRREQMEVWLEDGVEPAEIRRRLEESLPAGLDVEEVEEVGERLPSLQSSVRSARYEVTFDSRAVDAEALRDRVGELLARETLDWEEQRGGSDKVRRYDLRATVIDLCVREGGGHVVLEMRLALEEGKTGRPASVLAALGVEAEPLETVRMSLDIQRRQVAMQAWRERGRFEE